MKMDFMLSIIGNKIYKEVRMDESIKKLSIGTRKDCQFRLKKDRFYSEFLINVIRRDDVYVASCSDEIYFETENNADIREKVTELVAGTKVKVCYADSGIPLLILEFSFDFENIQDNYLRCIDTPVGRNYTIGGVTGSDIQINDKLLNSESIVYSHLSEGLYEIDLSNSYYGIHVNGAYYNDKRFRLENNQFFSLCGYSFFIDGDKLYTSSSFDILTKLRETIIQESNNCYKYPKFIRSARQKYLVPAEKIKVLPPQSRPKEPTRGYLLSLLPMLISMIAMMGLRFAMGSNPLYAVYFAVFMLSSIIVSIIRFRQKKNEYKQHLEKREQVYKEYVEKKVKQIEAARAEEKLILNKMEIPADVALKEIKDFDSHLFEKEKSHADYLVINIGQGTMKSLNQVNYNEREFLEVDDEYMNYPEQIHDSYEYISDVPVLLDLNNNNAVGVIGDRDKLYSFAQNLIVTIAAQHFYKDTKIILIIDDEDAEKFAWARWIKHIEDEDTGRRYILYDNDSIKAGEELIYNMMTQREQSKAKNFTDFVVMVYRSEQISGHPINDYISKARQLGFTFVFFEEKEELVNHDCDVRVFLDATKNQGYLQSVADGTKLQSFVYPELIEEMVRAAAVKMAGVYVEEVSLETTLTKNITLFELLGIMNAYDLDLESRWRESKIYDSMAAPLGVRGDGSTLALDIHEKAHGPHGLVAGTTGSGKSEIIQSYVLSMATLFHPYEVGFIIIDFKGGGMANQFKNLPHLNGAITNIDGKQIDRSLSSIKAELLKRQELFAKYEVNHIDDYIRLFRDNVAKVPLPHLILIVDEFAELKSEQPEFMKELISTARIGRSLGVHLILATQKPAGVVNDQIWSNSRFKLCLKVQDKSDSNEVIKSPLAAEIKEPGRAYLQVGNNEIFELFQSGYSGAPASIEGIDEQSKFDLSVVGLDGRRTMVYSQGKNGSYNADTQLDTLVKRIEEYCKEKNIERLQDICLPPLAEIIPFPGMSDAKTPTEDIVIPIGMYDDPMHQSQSVTYLNLSQENVAISGATQSGKTNLIQTIIRASAELYAPTDITFYILDCASMTMANFKDLAHVGGVATSEEPEKVRNLIRLLSKEISKRKAILAEMGLSSYSAYRDAGKRELPQIVFVLENLLAFREYYIDYVDALMDICREGNAMGICSVITAPQASGFNMKMLAAFPKRIVMNSNDQMDYSLLLSKCKLRPDENPGRCLTVIDRENYEAQIYLAFDAEKEIDRKASIDKFIAEINAKYGDYVRTGIPEVPNMYDHKYVMANFADKAKLPYQLLMGMNYADTQPVFIDLARKNLLAISGQQRHMGKKSYMNYIVRSLDANKDAAPVEFHILDSYERLLEECSTLDSVKTYTLMASEIDEQVGNIVKELERRKNILLGGGDNHVDNEPLIVIILNSAEYYSLVSTSALSIQKYRDIIGKYSSFKVSIILTDVPNASVAFGATELVKAVSGQKHMLMYENIGNLKLIDLPMNFQKQNRRPLRPGEAFMFNEGDYLRIKTPVWRLEE